jgi:hypothetical protein
MVISDDLARQVLLYGRLMNSSNSFGYFDVPSPVIGSHPSTASNPALSHPGLVPFVMSIRTCGFAYNVGLMKPTGLFPPRISPR